MKDNAPPDIYGERRLRKPKKVPLGIIIINRYAKREEKSGQGLVHYHKDCHIKNGPESIGRKGGNLGKCLLY